MLSDILQYKDIKYTWWRTGGCERMFYADDKEDIHSDDVREIGINCAGLINLIRRQRGLFIPDLTDDQKKDGIIRGGTYHWFMYFQQIDALTEFDIDKEYDVCTLILRRYKNETDQGHMAIIINKTDIIHAYAYDTDTGIVGVTSLIDSHASGYYEYAISPSHWLL